MAEAEREHQAERGQEPTSVHSYQLDPNKIFTPKPHTKGENQ